MVAELRESFTSGGRIPTTPHPATLDPSAILISANLVGAMVLCQGFASHFPDD